jgi:hypothetical protein
MHVGRIIYTVTETIICVNNIKLEKFVVIDGYIPSSVISQPNV